MSENRTMLLDSAAALFEDVGGLAFEQAWPRVEAAGFPLLLVPEEAGGFGGDWGDFFAVMRLAGSVALPLPLGETIIATALLVEAGIDVPAGPLSIAATLNDVPFGGQVAAVVVADGAELRLYPQDTLKTVALLAAPGDPSARMQGEAGAVAPSRASTLELGALLRVGQSAGALEAALRLAMDHTSQRVQFGKTLSQQQAVQQSLAILAVEAAAIDVGGQAAASALDKGNASWEIAAAKLRTNMAIGTGTGLAHQVHGAIGFTKDYDLHRFTLRLMAWRSQFGNDHHWSAVLGEKAIRAGGNGLWAEFTKRGDSLAADARA